MIAAVLAQVAWVFEAYDRTTVGMHASQPVPIVALPSKELGKEIIGLDLATAATFRLTLGVRRLTCSFAYTPSVSSTDVELGLQPVVLNAGTVALAWNDRFARITLSETASYGQISAAVPYTSAATATAQGSPPANGGGTTTGTSSMAPAGGATTTGTGTSTLLLNSIRTIDFGSSASTGAISVRTGRRGILTLSGGYTVTGGSTPLARTVLPEQYGEFANLLIGTAPSRQDFVSTSFSASDTRTSHPCTTVPAGTPPATCFQTQNAPIAQVMEGVRHQFSPTVMMSLSGGAAATELETPQLDEIVIQPVANLVLSDAFGGEPANTGVLTSGLAPIADPFTGYPSNRFQTTASLNTQWTPEYLTNVTVSVLKSVGFPLADLAPVTAFSGGAELRWHVDKQLDVSFSLQEFWQNQVPAGSHTAVSLASTIGFVAVTLRVPPMHF